MEHGTVIKVAEGKFPFHFWIQKAVAGAEEGKMIVEGVASTPNVDHDHERMHPEALKAMANIINTTGVPLRVEHSQNDNAIIGNVNRAWVDERNQLWIKAVLDEDHPAAGILYKGLKDGVKMGLSVGGYVQRATQEMVEGVGHLVNTFYDVLLDEVSVTQKPSNYDARLMAKSFAKSEKEIDALAGAFEGDDFLFHSAMGASSYLHAISKSVKEDDWKDITKGSKLIDKNKDMDEKETDKTTKAEEKEEEKTTKGSEKEETTKAKEDETEMSKSVTRGEFLELVKTVGDLGNSITAALTKMAKAMDSDAKDSRQPDEKKEDPEEGKDVSKTSDGGPKDQHQPDENKEDPEEGKNVGKAKADGSDEDGEREKSRAKKGEKEDTYDLETVERAIKRIKAVTKGMDETDEKKTTKAEDKEEEKVTKSQISSMDEFVIGVADYIEGREKVMKSAGFQTEHLAKAMINELRSNPEFRKDIAHFMTEPGKKRSVVNGTPFVKMKDGRMFALTLSETGAERTEKSAADAPKDFKSMWGAKFSSTPVQE